MHQLTAPVSVIIPCYRCMGTIERSLLSIIEQTRSISEIILVDDCSADGTLDFLYQLQEKYRNIKIEIISLPINGGPGVARNAGWDIAKEPWIAFLDSDDIWHPRKIEIQFSWMMEYEDIDLGAHETSVWSELDNSKQDFKKNGDTKSISAIKMLFRNSIPTRSVILRRGITKRFEISRNAEDYMLWLEMAFSGMKMKKIPMVLAYSFREDSSPGGLSGQLLTHEIQEIKCYFRLYKNQFINIFFCCAAVLFSIMKFIKRWIKSFVYAL